MLQKLLLIFSSVILISDKSETLNYNFESGESPLSSNNPGSASAAGAIQVSYLEQKPAQPKSLIDLLARLISDGILNSAVLLKYSSFRVEQPHDLLYRVGSAFLKRAGICDCCLPEIAAAAVKKAGYLDSELYFNAIGYMVAKFLFEAGFLKNEERVTYFSLRVVSAIDLVACTEGVFNTESVMNSVAGGLYKVFDLFGLVNYDRLAELFYLFADEIDVLSTKIAYDFSEIDL